jgi:hypothetical protein
VDDEVLARSVSGGNRPNGGQDVDVGGFVGARTNPVVPAALNDPPGVDYVLLEVTLTEAYLHRFANIGITIFRRARFSRISHSGLTQLSPVSRQTERETSSTSHHKLRTHDER